MDEGFRPKPGSVFEIEVEYFDGGSGEIALDYDSTDLRAPVGRAYKRHPDIIRRTNSAQCRLVHFRLNDARFRHSQNGEADFRFYNGGDDLLIREVRVRRVGP